MPINSAKEEDGEEEMTDVINLIYFLLGLGFGVTFEYYMVTFIGICVC